MYIYIWYWYSIYKKDFPAHVWLPEGYQDWSSPAPPLHHSEARWVCTPQGQTCAWSNLAAMGNRMVLRSRMGKTCPRTLGNWWKWLKIDAVKGQPHQLKILQLHDNMGLSEATVITKPWGQAQQTQQTTCVGQNRVQYSIVHPGSYVGYPSYNWINPTYPTNNWIWNRLGWANKYPQSSKSSIEKNKNDICGSQSRKRWTMDR